MTKKSAIAKARRINAKTGRPYAVVHCGAEEYTVKALEIARAYYPQDITETVGA